MTNNRLLELLTRKLSGEATDNELREIDLLMSADPETSERIRQIEKFWNENETNGAHFIDEAFEKLKLRLSADDSDQIKSPDLKNKPDRHTIIGIITTAASIIRLFFKKNALVPVN
ncbi:MAG: hypothetical protein ABW174_11610 [Flavitalea sp.]